VHWSAKKPLIVLTPKKYLRGREAYSGAAEFTSGHFREVLDDSGLPDRAPERHRETVRRVILATGKMALDLMVERDKRGIEDIAIVRVEQLYPWPEEQIVDLLASYEQAGEVYWVQEEPENMGAWSFVHSKLHRLLRDDYVLSHVSRSPSGSPATGSFSLHQLEHEDLLDRAFAEGGSSSARQV
jgi:2-oxoglutarate dehydrogenase E1 component